ncbi:hypothetical protein DFH94DRAFT_685068 [Russula ochroleuca]|uniref:Uncharacterized protein n=1 Tax=Russula ochroleuca TaxID=152965 RepID=A0A9P5JXG1_9AGAM|nr:hypothetical protein DFH94DRAFT_685068 [Russula ochroleuca]
MSPQGRRLLEGWYTHARGEVANLHLGKAIPKVRSAMGRVEGGVIRRSLSPTTTNTRELEELPALPGKSWHHYSVPGCLALLHRRESAIRLWLFESARCAWAMMGIGVNNEDNFALTPWTVKGKDNEATHYALREWPPLSARALPPTLRILQIKVNRGRRGGGQRPLTYTSPNPCNNPRTGINPFLGLGDVAQVGDNVTFDDEWDGWQKRCWLSPQEGSPWKVLWPHSTLTGKRMRHG